MKNTIVGAAILATQAVAAIGTNNTCCQALASRTELQGKILGPGAADYDARLQTYYSANAALSPWCMVLPESTEDVSVIAKTLTENQCPFGMRSGAHSAFKLSNGIQDGITVDFSYLNATTYDPSTKLASIRPGTNWGEVYKALNKYNVTTVGGRASVVGVGGFTTGGGYSFHSNSRGFACDNVANFEVVLADGSVVNANAHENADLWKSLKGASGNFGFVTRIDEHIVESNVMWGGFLNFDLSERDAVFQAYLNFADNMHTDPASQLIVSFQYNGTDRLLLSVMSNIDAVEMAPAFDEFRTIRNTSSTLSTGLIADLVPQFTGPTPLGLYANWMAGMVSSDIRILQFMDDKHAEYVNKMKAAAPDAEFSVLVQLQPVTPSIVQHSIERGGNVLGLEAVVADGPAQMWLIAVTVDTAENQDKIHPLTIQYREEVEAYATELGANKNWVYLNYALGDQDPIAHYGEESVAFVKQTAQTYDPEGVFQKLRGSGFKLPA